MKDLPSALRLYGQLSYPESPRTDAAEAPIGLGLINAPLPYSSRGLVACISSRITTVIHVTFTYLRNRN